VDADTDVNTGTDSNADTDSDSETQPQQLSGNPCDDRDNPWECAPVYKQGRVDYCPGEDNACDWGIDEDYLFGFFCFKDSTEELGEACSVEGPYCRKGLACVSMENDGECMKYCCNDDDCAGLGENHTCQPFGGSGDGLWGDGFAYIENASGDIELGACMEK
jgi:hypothetical protein